MQGCRSRTLIYCTCDLHYDHVSDRSGKLVHCIDAALERSPNGGQTIAPHVIASIKNMPKNTPVCQQYNLRFKKKMPVCHYAIPLLQLDLAAGGQSLLTYAP
jgi:hypothetical protein